MTAGEGFDTESAVPADGSPAAEPAPPRPEETTAPAGGTPAHAGAETLEEIAARPLAEHPDGYERVHAELRSALAEIDDA